MIRRRHFVVSSCAASVGVRAAAQAKETSGVLRLGQSLPLSGPHASLGTAYRAAAMATFGEFARTAATSNAPRVELISLDDGGQPERTAVNVKLLAAEHRVHALFGFVGSGADRVGSRAAVVEGLPYVAPVSGSVELRTSRSPGTLTFRASHAEEIRYIARHAETIGVTRLALVYEYNFLGWELRDTVLDLLEAGGNRQVALTSIDREGSPYSVPGAVEAVLTKQPQAIILGSNALASAGFVRAARSAGFKGYLYALSSVGSQGLGEQLGPLVSGISITQVVPFALSSKTAVSRNHRAFCSRHRIEPSSHSMEAWIGATLFVESMKRLRSIGSAAIADALTASVPFDFGDYIGQWYASRPNPKAYVSLAVYDRYGRLIE
jgi:branched-chain amino acid transport system substrate-binding protein